MRPQESLQNPFPLTPDQLLQALQSLLNGEAFRRFREEGPYLVQGTYANNSPERRLYGGFYYGELKGDGTSISLKVPARIPLEEGRTYVLSVSPELARNGKGFVFQVHDLHGEGQASTAPEARLPRKSRGRVDVQGLLTDLLRKGETPSIALILGESAIVDRDVEASLGEGRSRYRMDKRPVNLTDPSAVAEAIAQAAGGPYHLLALIRGGGEGLQTLDHSEVWEAVASCPKPIVVALGHAANTLWVETLADQSFPTPTALGHFLKQAVEAVEREKETAKLTDLLHKAQEEVRVVRAEREQLKERLARLEREPAALAQEVARLKQSLKVWRALALLFLAVAALLFLARG
jgi:exodeoxyribonuclease VII large subunit